MSPPRCLLVSVLLAIALPHVAITYALVTERSPDRGTIEPGHAQLPLMRW